MNPKKPLPKEGSGPTRSLEEFLAAVDDLLEQSQETQRDK